MSEKAYGERFHTKHLHIHDHTQGVGFHAPVMHVGTLVVVKDLRGLQAVQQKGYSQHQGGTSPPRGITENFDAGTRQRDCTRDCNEIIISISF